MHTPTSPIRCALQNLAKHSPLRGSAPRHRAIAVGFARAGVALALAAASPLALAQTALTLQEALHLSATAHPSVLARRSDKAGAQARLEAAQWQRYPQLSAQAAAGTAGSQESALVVQVPLWTAGRIEADIGAARSRTQASDDAVATAQQSIMETALTAFGDWCRLSDRRAAVAASVEQHARLAALIERRADMEISSRSDLTLAQSRLGQVQGELRLIEAQIAVARSALEQAVGRPVAELVPMAHQDLPFADVALAVDTARQASPELRRLAREADAAARDLDARRAARLPQVIARYRHNLGSGTAGNGGEAFVGLEYQSGPGLSASAAVREAEARVESLRLEAQTRQQQLAERARTDWLQARTLGLQAEELRRALQGTREVAESMDRQYVAGRKSWIEVLNAHREVAQVAQTLADAYWSAQLAVRRLQLLAGQLPATPSPGTGSPP
jgi:adhesin transport system outer membrane protein